MQQYLLSTYAVEGQVPGSPSTQEEMQSFMERVMALEAEMDQSGAFVFGGALLNPEEAHVLSQNGAGLDTAQGPTVDSPEQIAGFYIINAEDEAAAMDWAGKVVAATKHAIEVRPFRATGQIKDQMPS